METLKSYLQSSRETQAEFAARVLVKQGTVSKLIAGRILPSMKLAQRIDVATAGRVPVACWAMSFASQQRNEDLSFAAPAAPTQEQPHDQTSKA